MEHLVEGINNEIQDTNEHYSRDDLLSLLDTIQIHWIPYLNPDGRILAETTQPFRRKNVNIDWTGNLRDSEICSPDSYGVDLNRNFPFE